jgi:hypothetical protein
MRRAACRHWRTRPWDRTPAATVTDPVTAECPSSSAIPG